MKKFSLFLSMIFCCFLFSSCDPAISQFDTLDLKENLVEIALIDYENPEQKQFISWIPNCFSKLVPFETSNSTIVEVLSKEKYSKFIEQLSEVSILSEYYAFDSPNDLCIQLSYENGDFLILTCNRQDKSYRGYIWMYSQNGDVKNFIGSFERYDSFQSLVNNFFDTKI